MSPIVSMKLTQKEVEHVAQLARLDLTAEEKKKFAKQLSSILDYISELGKVNTEGVEPTSQVTGLKDVSREDRIMDCPDETKKLIFKNIPEKEGDYIKVKGVFDN